MTVTAAMVARLRRMVNEPTEQSYTDAVLSDQIVEYPLPDSAGLESAATGWVPTYDLYQKRASECFPANKYMA